MRDINFDWCFEGGCTDIGDVGATREVEPDTEELEGLYREPCIACAD